MEGRFARAKELSASFAAELVNVPRARRLVRTFCERLDIPPRVRDSVALAVTEASANAVIHASGARDNAGRFEVEASCDSAVLRVVVRDFGGGIVPRTDSPGIGAGLPLMAALAENLDLRSRGWATEVVMTFDLHAEPAKPARQRFPA